LSSTQFIPDRRGKQVIQIFFDIEQVWQLQLKW
jgi:hypothetical protein